MKNNSTTKKEGFQLKNGDSIIISSRIGSGVSKIINSLDDNLRKLIITPDSMARASLGIEGSYGKAIRIDNNVCDMLFKSFFMARSEQGLSSIIVDPFCINNEKRNQYRSLSKKTGSSLTFIELDNEISEESLTLDAEFFGLMNNEAKTINSYYEKPNASGDMLTLSDINIFMTKNEIPSTHIDIIGDIHGMYNELVDMILKMGYEINNKDITHPEGRKLVFLGDYIDRGYDSLKTILLIKMAVESGHYAIKGNHEEMLLQSIKSDGQSDIIYTKSISSAGTVDKVLRMLKAERDELLEFISSLPSYLTCQDYAFVHADIERFDPLLSVKNSLVFGDSILGRKNSDEKYFENYKNGINKYKIIRGHSKSFLNNGVITSLENGQAYGGELLGLRFDLFKKLTDSGGLPKDCFEQSRVSVSCASYNYSEKIKERVSFVKNLKSLVEKDLIKRVDSLDNKFHMVDLSDNVYKNKTWENDCGLKNLRGMVFSVDGHVVISGQSKMGEIGLTSKKLNKNEKVFLFENPYGFNINIGRNPYENGLIISTNSSFSSNYTDMAREYMLETGVYDKIDHFFMNNNITLNLSVSHYLDKRNPYCKTPLDNDITLISGKYNESLEAIDQGELNKIAILLGIKRPDVSFLKFASVRDFVFSSKNHSIAIHRAGENIGECYKIPTLSGLIRDFKRSVKGVNSWDDFIESGRFIDMNDILKNSMRKIMDSTDFKKIKLYEEEFISEKIKPIVKSEIISFMKESGEGKDFELTV